MNADQIPHVALLRSMILALTVIAGPGSGLLTSTVMADEKPDPWLGTYTVYERSSDDLFHVSNRHNGKVLVCRKGGYYTIDIAPKAELRKVNDRLLDAEDSSGNPRIIEIQMVDGQRILVVKSSFCAIYLVAGNPPQTWKLATAAEEPTPRLPEASKWGLRDYKINGQLENNRSVQQTPLALKLQGNQLSGQFWEEKVCGLNNHSSFSGEIVTRERPLLILRQEDQKDGTYVVIHAGHQVGADHYRGVWHDNSGQSGDFELKSLLAVAREDKPALTLTLKISKQQCHVVLHNNTNRTIQLYRDALKLIVSGNTGVIPRFPKVFPPELPQDLKPGKSLTWPIIVKQNELYPYSVDRGGLRLFEAEHKVKAVYEHTSLGRIESKEVAFKFE